MRSLRQRTRDFYANLIEDLGKDLEMERQLQARETTVSFIDEALGQDIWEIRSRDARAAQLELLERALGEAPQQGLAVEFGVASGRTLRVIASLRPGAHGFDSFAGLPETWRPGFDRSRFAQRPPRVRGASLHVGWFEDTLPTFLEDHEEAFAFVHMDADLYSSTATVFRLARDRFVRGTVIVFDEYFNYPGWQQHEHLAFQEFLAGYTGGFEYLGYSTRGEQLAVRLT